MFRQLTTRTMGVAARAARPSPVPNAVFLRNIHASVPDRKNEEPLPPSFMETYKLNCPTRFVPLTAGTLCLLSVPGIYHWDAESQMLGLFALFVGTIYSQGGDAIGKFFDDTADEVLKEHQALEDAQIDAVKLALDAHKRQTVVYEDIKMIFEAQKGLMGEVVDAAGAKLKHEVRANFVKKLDTIAHAEQAAAESVQATLVDNATAYVTSQYANDSGSLTGDALNSALNAIANPAENKDNVGDIYKSYFEKCRQNWANDAGKEVKLDASIVEAANDAMQSVGKRDGLEVKPYPSTLTV